MARKSSKQQNIGEQSTSTTIIEPTVVHKRLSIKEIKANPLTLAQRNEIGIKRFGKLKYNDPVELASKINEYVVECKENNLPLTMSGLALHLDLDRVSLINYERYFPESKELFSAIKKARLTVEASFEGKLVSGVPATGLIFGLKNNFGWKDQMQLDVTSNGESVFDRDSILLASKELLLDAEKEDQQA